MEYKNHKFGPTVAADSLGRELPTAAEVGNFKQDKNRLVGVFYFLWLGEHGREGPYDISKILKENPGVPHDPDNPVWGKVGTYHFWGEPFYGYYLSSDEWVMRKHIEMLTLADVDFVFFDTTNAVTYEPNAKKFMTLLDEYIKSGWDVPKVMFYTNTQSGKTVQTLYDNIYKINFMPDTWFYYQGKPVIIAVEDECGEEAKAFFTIKQSQWPNEPQKINAWPWMDFVRPQRVIKNLDGEDEVINVSIAQHPQILFGDSAMYGEETNRGRAFHDGVNDKSEDAYKHGYNVKEQWERAYETDPNIVLFTGWNEWIAGRWNSFGRKDRPIEFVDCANHEFSRDAELMRGGYFDNYYLQLISNIRRYKGCCATPEHKKHSIDIDGDFSQWDDISVTYHDFPNSAIHRDSGGYGNLYYKNDSGRNNIIAAKAAFDEDNFYFYAKCSEKISNDRSGTFMTLFLISDGREYIISEAPKISGSEIMYSIPRNYVNAQNGDFSIRFKWCDSKTEIKTFEDMYEFGDSAPIGRLYYLFKN